MAIVFGSALATVKRVVPDSDETADAHAAGVTVYAVEVDNTANSAVSYTKLYNTATPTVGTTAPDVVLMTPAGVKLTHVLCGGTGFAFSTACAVATVTGAGTAGTAGPSSVVEVVLHTGA